MLETYLPCSEKNVLAFISPPVLRANSRMTVARNRMSREESADCQEFIRLLIPGASQARPRSRRYKTRSRAFSLPFGAAVKRCCEFSEFHPTRKEQSLSRNEWREERERGGGDERIRRGAKREERVTWHAAGYCVLESAAVSTLKQLCSIGRNLLRRDSSYFFTPLVLLTGRTRVVEMRERTVASAIERATRNYKFQNWQSSGPRFPSRVLVCVSRLLRWCNRRNKAGDCVSDQEQFFI